MRALRTCVPLKNLSSTTSVTMSLLSTRGLGRHGSPDLVLIRAERTSSYIFARDHCSTATTRLDVRERQEFLAALPEDLRNEILAAERDEESHQQEARQLQAAA
jgi:hypothetical protein